jgi:hypothetical protein
MATMRPGMGRFRKNRRPWLKRPVGRPPSVKSLRWAPGSDEPPEEEQ